MYNFVNNPSLPSKLKIEALLSTVSPQIQIGFSVAAVNRQRRVPLNRHRPLSSHHITVLMMEETPSNENSEEHSITPPPNDATPTAVAVAVADCDTDAGAGAGAGADADADAKADHHHHENTVPDPINHGYVYI